MVVQSISHTRWNCTYHIVFIPKYRRNAVRQVTVHTLTAPEWRDTSKKMNNFRPRRLSHDT